MNRREVVQMLAVVASYEPNMAQGEHVTTAWLHALGDLPYAACVTAVVEHYRVDTWPVKPAHVRRVVLTKAGMMPPPADRAIAAIVQVASNSGVGRRELQPFVRHFYDSNGGSSIANRDVFGIDRLRKAYVEAYEAAARAALARSHEEPDVAAALALHADAKALT